MKNCSLPQFSVEIVNMIADQQLLILGKAQITDDEAPIPQRRPKKCITTRFWDVFGPQNPNHPFKAIQAI